MNTGVVPWLTERQSKCPLCKFDVGEYLRQLQAEQRGTVDGGGDSGRAWNPLAWFRYRSWTAVAAAEAAGNHGHSDDEEERQTMVIELAEQSGTLT